MLHWTLLETSARSSLRTRCDPALTCQYDPYGYLTRHRHAPAPSVLEYLAELAPHLPCEHCVFRHPFRQRNQLEGCPNGAVHTRRFH
eukprot:COSAG06_NODE_35839_length_455_cov_0.654494_1_plen_86_part_10